MLKSLLVSFAIVVNFLSVFSFYSYDSRDNNKLLLPYDKNNNLMLVDNRDTDIEPFLINIPKATSYVLKRGMILKWPKTNFNRLTTKNNPMIPNDATIKVLQQTWAVAS